MLGVWPLQDYAAHGGNLPRESSAARPWAAGQRSGWRPLIGTALGVAGTGGGFAVYGLIKA